MNEILFVSETEILPELELAKNEIAHYGCPISFTVSMMKAVEYLKATTANTVLINAYERKLEAYELCKEIKETFRGAIKVIVFLPESSPNEGSRFGLLNAEVEDKKSIANVIDKLPKKDSRDYLLDENVISFYSLNGGSGSSFMTILCAYVLNSFKHSSLVLESSNSMSIRSSLGLDSRIPILTRDKAKEYDQAKDVDWFKGFLSHTNFIPRMHYLNLFSQSIEKSKFVEGSGDLLQKLSLDIDKFLDKGAQLGQEEMKAQLFGLSNSLKLIAKEIEGDSYSLFDEIIQLGSKLSKNFLFDLSSDIVSPLNKQLLKFTNNLVIVFNDVNNIKEEYQLQKQYFLDNYKLKVIPVIAAAHYYYAKYESLSEADWMQILGDIPLIYPYDPEAAIRFSVDKEPLSPKSKLFAFARDLLNLAGVKMEKKSYDVEMNNKHGVLNFLSKNR